MNKKRLMLFCFGMCVATTIAVAYVAAQAWANTNQTQVADREPVAVERALAVVAQSPDAIARSDNPGSALADTLRLPPGQPVTLTDANFVEQVAKSSRPVIVDFWAAWCGPCRVMAPRIEQTAAAFGKKVLVGKLNVDENPIAARALQVEALPTLLIFKDGRIVDKIVGLSSQEEISRRLEVFVDPVDT